MVTGLIEGDAGQPPREVAKITAENIAELDMIITDQSLKDLEALAKKGAPFFMSINFAKNHNPNLPSKSFKDKSPDRWPYADAVVELDDNIGRIMDKIRALGIDKNTFVFYTSDNGAWRDVAPDAGYTPFRGSKGTDREGGSRVPGIAWWPGRIAAGSQTHEIAGGLDLMATYARLAGVELPKNDREGKPMIFDSHDMGPLLFGQGEYTRKNWFYFTEEELLLGAIRIGRYKIAFNLRGDNGAVPGADDNSPQLGWLGPAKYVASIPDVYDLMQDPQERINIVMRPESGDNSWLTPMMVQSLQEIMESYDKYPPRPMQSYLYTGPISIDRFRTVEQVKALLKEKKIDLPKLN
ncbi:MAG: sulfatase-like hydrolase/transferase [Desulfobacterales bacterium]